MKSNEEITEIVTKHAGYKLNVAKYPTWMKNDKLEGFEIVLGKLKTFWIKDMQKEYEAPSEVWRKVIDEVLDIPPVPAQKQPEAPQQNEQTEQQQVTVPTAMMPEYLSDALIEKYRKLSPEARLLMMQHTDKRYVRERPGRAGQKYQYVEGHYMHQAANLAFLFLWGSEVKDVRITETEVFVWGTVWGDIEGSRITKASVGQQDIKYRKDSKIPLCLGDDVKAAVTDMEKKGLSKFGIAADVYRGEI